MMQIKKNTAVRDVSNEEKSAKLKNSKTEEGKEKVIPKKSEK